MIVVHLKGGLGNQMFQYAAARNLAIKYRTKLYADLDSFLQTSREGYTARNYELGIFDISIKSINKNTKMLFTKQAVKKISLKN
jgi:hypothetical protein